MGNFVKKNDNYVKFDKIGKKNIQSSSIKNNSNYIEKMMKINI